MVHTFAEIHNWKMHDSTLVSTIVHTAEDILEQLGPGLSECIYQAALSNSLRYEGHKVDNETSIPVRYMDMYCGFIRADVIVDQTLCLELKAKSALSSTDTTQACTYLKHCRDVTQCLLINFGTTLSTKLLDA